MFRRVLFSWLSVESSFCAVRSMFLASKDDVNASPRGVEVLSSCGKESFSPTESDLAVFGQCCTDTAHGKDFTTIEFAESPDTPPQLVPAPPTATSSLSSSSDPSTGMENLATPSEASVSFVVKQYAASHFSSDEDGDEELSQVEVHDTPESAVQNHKAGEEKTRRTIRRIVKRKVLKKKKTKTDPLSRRVAFDVGDLAATGDSSDDETFSIATTSSACLPVVRCSPNAECRTPSPSVPPLSLDPAINIQKRLAANQRRFIQSKCKPQLGWNNRQ